MRRGFTLLEAIIAVTLLGLVGLSFGYLASLSQRLMIQSMGSSTAQGEAAFALEHIKRHLMRATAIVRPTVGENPPPSILEFTWQSTSLLAARTSRYELGGTGNTDLRFIPDTAPAAAGAFEVVSQGVQTITFTRATAGTVSVNVTARKTTGGDSRNMRLQTSISPRGLS